MARSTLRRVVHGPLLILMAALSLSACHAAPPSVEARAVELAGRGATLLPADYVRRALDGAGMEKAVAAANAKANSGPEAARHTRTDQQARALLKAVETAFILDPNASTLDLLPEPERTKYKNFQWDENDYPGGPEGPHEDEVIALDAALDRIRPERRANSTPTAVVVKAQFNEDVWKYIQAQERPIPGQEQRKLNRFAQASFVQMRDAAKKDGVDIFALSANRDPAVAARNAARTANPFAVASFSSHMLGLAMDVRMSQGAQKFDEVTTRPMSSVIAMRSSPVHKWLFVRGAAHGWYPYTHEPWHWEYNPPGFRARFWKDFPGGIPTPENPGDQR